MREGFFMKNMIGSSLVSVGLHGILLAYCFAIPAQIIIPMFQAGSSALTLTALSVAPPADESSQSSLVMPHEANLEAMINDVFEEFTEKDFEQAEESKPEKRNISADADPDPKGVINSSAEFAGIRPYYPLAARMRGEEGVVKVEICLGPNGRVLECNLAKSSGFPALDNAALKAVRNSRFISADSLPIRHACKTTLTFRFDLVD